MTTTNGQAENRLNVLNNGTPATERLLREILDCMRSQQAELLDSSAAAAFLGVGRTKFFEMVSAVAQLKPVKLPGCGRMWRRSDLAAFVEGLAK